MKIWLDDERKEPKGFVRTKTAEETIELLKQGEVTYIGFDHDLGTKMNGRRRLEGSNLVYVVFLRKGIQQEGQFLLVFLGAKNEG